MKLSTVSAYPTRSITVGSNQHCIQLRYTRTPNGRDPENKAYSVALEGMPCGFGGFRPWFRCPWCDRRVALLYGLSGDGYFGCRRCLRLGYMSEAESPLDRLWRKQCKLESRLGDDGERPKRMRCRTYERICARIDKIEEQKDAAFCFRAMRLLGWNIPGV